MTILSRWLAPAVLAAGLGFGALAPAPAQAQDDVLTRVLVDVADVVFNNGVPYYRYGNDGYDDRLVVVRDRYGRPVYYRQVPYGYNGYNGYNAYNGYGNAFPRQAYDRYGRPIYDRYGHRIDYSHYNRNGPPYGNAYGYYGNAKCNKHGKCKQTYYDDRYDHDGDHWGRGDHEDDDDDD